MYKLSKSWSRSLFFCKFHRWKSSHFNRNDWEFHWKVKDFSMQISQQGQVCHTDLVCWPTESCLVWKSLLCELCFIQCYTIDNRQWTFFYFSLEVVWWILQTKSSQFQLGVKFSQFATHSYLSKTRCIFPKEIWLVWKWLLCAVLQKCYTIDNGWQ